MYCLSFYVSSFLPPGFHRAKFKNWPRSMYGPPGVHQNQSLLNLKHFISEQLQKSQKCEKFCMNKGTAEYCSSSEALLGAVFVPSVRNYCFFSLFCLSLPLRCYLSKLSTSSFFPQLLFQLSTRSDLSDVCFGKRLKFCRFFPKLYWDVIDTKHCVSFRCTVSSVLENDYQHRVD